VVDEGFGAEMGFLALKNAGVIASNGDIVE
jgi:hypothetical protein